MRRNYLSGAEKRKLKRKKEDDKNLLKGSLAKFFKRNDKDGNGSTNDDSPSISDEIVEEKTSETITVNDQQSASEEVNMPEEIMIKSNFDSDPALWLEVNDQMREYFALYPPQQNTDLIQKTVRIIDNKKRCLTENHFFRKKCNEEKIRREWLILSESTGSLFCWICKLFSVTMTALSQTGFSDWKHVSERLQDHENSYSHREAVCTMTLRKEASARIDVAITEQTYSESKYWFEVLRRVVSVTKFLSTRGLAFFGRNETVGSQHNGNFLGCMELLSEYDPFLAQHMEKYGNPGSGRTSYLSSTTISEFIELMANKVLKKIISDVKNAKYFSIILDSTPDVSNTDQLCFVIRYVSSDCEPVERFLTFLPIHGHSSAHIEDTVTQFMEDKSLSFSYCRGQSYDNASNMAGKYNGLQARIKALNPLAEFIPCSAHSLNLVIVKSVECNGKVLDFFTFLQELYNFFSTSTHRWKLLNDKLSEANSKNLTLKSRSATRWCANAAATRALNQNYKEIIDVLTDLSANKVEAPITRHEATSLCTKLRKLETAIFAKTWDDILQRVNSVSKILQSPSVNLSEVPGLFYSLIEFVDFIRNRFDEYEREASLLVGHECYATKRKVRPPQHIYDGNAANVELDSKEAFKVSCFYVICDTLIVHLKSRMSVYESVSKKFSCLFDSDKQKAYENAKLLQNTYSCDLEDSFPEEFVQFLSIVEKESTVTDKLKKIKKVGISDTFANVETALKLFLTLPISNCSGERSFSLLKHIKSRVRTLMSDFTLSSLSILSIEGDITKMLDYEDVITDFTAKKFRRKIIKS